VTLLAEVAFGQGINGGLRVGLCEARSSHSDDGAGRVYFDVALAEDRDGALVAQGVGAQIDKEGLVFAQVMTSPSRSCIWVFSLSFRSHSKTGCVMVVASRFYDVTRGSPSAFKEGDAGKFIGGPDYDK
jgi:hypothetical protein